MNKSDKLAKILEKEYNLPIKLGTYRRNKREDWQDEVCRWAMKVDMNAIPEYGTPREQCRKIQIVTGVFVRGQTQEEKISTLGLYDNYYDNRGDNYTVGSDYTLDEILTTIELYGISYVGLTYRNGHFNIELYSRPLEYKGDYDEVRINAMREK